MSIEFIKMKTKVNFDPYYLLSAHKIIELILLAGVAYFMIATEMRFNQGTIDVNKMKIT